MGLTKQLQKENANEAQVLSTAVQPVADGGYNAQNVPALAQAQQQLPPMSVQEVQHVREVAQQSNMQTNYIQSQPGVNPNHLPKPSMPAGGGFNPEISALVLERMWRIVCVRNLFNFYTPSSLQTLVDRACKHDWRLIQSRLGHATIEETVDVAVMGLCDIIFFIDDSGSMSLTEPSEDGMRRMDIARQLVAKIAFCATLMDPDGVVVRAFNDSREGNGLSTVKLVDDFFNDLHPSGGTPLGSSMRARIIEPIVKPLLSRNELQRPILVITVTDGEPTVDSSLRINEKLEIEKVMKETKALFRSSKYGEFGIFFSYVQVGTDAKATEFLGYLDEHPEIGNFVDCTSSYVIEKEECEKKRRAVSHVPFKPFSPAEYVNKLMIGAVDPVYDAMDENGGRPTSQSASGGFMQSVSSVFGWGQQPSQPQYGQQGTIPVAQAYPVPNNQQYGGYHP